MPHRVGKDVFCWGRNSHGECSRVENFERKHDTMGEKNLHWATAAELIRGGGHKNRPNRIAPENADGMVDQLREADRRVHWGQHLIPTKAWWQKTTGAHPEYLGQSASDQPSGWKTQSGNWTGLE